MPAVGEADTSNEVLSRMLRGESVDHQDLPEDDDIDDMDAHGTLDNLDSESSGSFSAWHTSVQLLLLRDGSAAAGCVACNALWSNLYRRVLHE